MTKKKIVPQEEPSPEETTIEKLKNAEITSQEVGIREAFERGTRIALNEAIAEQTGYTVTRTELAVARTAKRIHTVRAWDGDILETQVSNILEEGVTDEDPLESLPKMAPIDTSLFL